MRIESLCIGLLLATAACGDDSPTGGSSQGGSPSTGGENTGAGQEGGAGGEDTNGGQAPGGAPQGGAGGSGDGGAQVGGAGGSAPCEPITEDASAIGMNCANAACPTGYTCQGHDGIVFQQLCAILCEEDCECPADHTCEMFSDKNSDWKECVGVLNK